MNTNSGAAAEIADSHVVGTAGFSWSASTALKGVAVLLMVFHHCYGFPQWFVSPDLIPSVLGGGNEGVCRPCQNMCGYFCFSDWLGILSTQG